MISSLTFCSGGFGTGGTSMCGAGKGTWPPRLKACSGFVPRLDWSVAIVRAGEKRRDPEPQPTEVITYCSPFTENVTGMESIADFVWMDQSFFPVSAA